MISKQLTINNKYGLHTRPASALVTLATRFKSEIFLIRDDMRVNAKSILGVLILAAESGAIITVEATGEDEKVAMNAIEDLVNRKFGTEQ